MPSDEAEHEILQLKVLYDRYGLTLGVTRDWLYAYVRYNPSGTGDTTSQENIDVLSEAFLKGLLTEHAIVFGVKDDAIQAFLADPPVNQDVLIAAGIEPQNGEDAKIEFLHEAQPSDGTPKLKAGGKVDHKDLNLNINVMQGEVLVRKVSATPGKPGKKVTGEEIPPKPGKDRHFPSGRNTSLSEDGLELQASVDGAISRTATNLSVVELFTVKADVDYSTGNINFVGSVDVMGSVLSGFRVEAKGDVTVIGVVEGAEVVAGGNVNLRRGVQGTEKAQIQAGGSIGAKFVNSAGLRAGEDIRIEGPVMHSNLQAGGKIELVGKNGVLAGGKTRATTSVEAEVIGSEAGVATVVQVGINPEMAERFREVIEQLEEARKTIPKLNKAIQTLNALKKASGKLPPDREKMLLDSIKTRYVLMGQVKQLEAEEKSIQEEIRQLKAGYVKVRRVVYPRVIIKIRNQVLRVDEEMKSPYFRIKDGDIVVG